jgi:hypothetical protein
VLDTAEMYAEWVPGHDSRFANIAGSGFAALPAFCLSRGHLK